jgi:hypothetical protein
MGHNSREIRHPSLPSGGDAVLDLLREVHEGIVALRESADFQEFVSDCAEDVRKEFIDAERLFRHLRLGRAFELLDAEAKRLEASVKGEAREKAEYDALSEYQRGAYDYLGQRGNPHAECLAGAHSL